jgi:hypothetical protein
VKLAKKPAKRPEPDFDEVPVAESSPLVEEKVAEAKPQPKRSRRPVAVPTPVMPGSEDDILNNVLCREIADPTDYQEPEDPSLPVLNRIARALVSGENITQDTEAVRGLTAYILEKRELYDAISVGIHDLHEKNEWQQIKAVIVRELRKMARRGDLKSYEYLALLKLSVTQLKDIDERQTNMRPVDALSLLHKLDTNRQVEELKVEAKYRGTTPQGREIIRKQVFLFQKKIEEAKRSRLPE